MNVDVVDDDVDVDVVDDDVDVVVVADAVVHCGTGERKLLNDLMTFYQKLERPVANESEAVQLRFGLTLQQIMDVVRAK